MFTSYQVTVEVDRLVGGIPAVRKPLAAWLDISSEKIKAQSLTVGAGLGDVPSSGAAITEDVTAMIEAADLGEMHSVIFYRDPDGRAVLESRCIKAALKEAANILKESIGIKNARAKLAEQVFVEPRFLPIEAEVQSDERPISVMTVRGPRTSLKRFEFVTGVRLSFRVKLLDPPAGCFQEKHIRTMLEYLQDGGIGSDRSQGNGTFATTHFGPA